MTIQLAPLIHHAKTSAVQANLARAKSLKQDDQRKADYYQGQADAYTQVLAKVANIGLEQAQDTVLDALMDLEG